MTALIVLASIVLFFAILLYPSFTVYVKIADEITIKVGAYGLKFTIIPQKEKAEKPKKTKGEPSKKKPKSKVDETTFGETVELVLTAIKAVLKPTAKLLSKVRLQAVDINIAVCGDDADKTAVKYGQINIAIFNTLSNLKRFIKVKIKRVDIRPDFVGDEDRYDIFFKVKLRLYQILGAGFSIFFKMVVNIIKRQLRKTPVENNKKVPLQAKTAEWSKL